MTDRTLRLFTTILLLTTGATCGPYAKAQGTSPDIVMKSRFITEAPKAWKEYKDRTNQLEGSISFTEVQHHPHERPYITRSLVFKQSSDGCLLLTQNEVSGGEPDQTGRVSVLNSNYAFELRRTSLSSPWAITDVRSEIASDAALTQKLRDDISLWTRCPITLAMMYDRIRVSPDDADFTVKSVSRKLANGRELAKVDFIYKSAKQPSYPTLSGWMTVDPSRFWTIDEFDVHIVVPGSNAEAFTKAAFEYSTDGGTLPWVKHIKQEYRNPQKSFDASTDYDFTLATRASTREDFRLAAFGFPEPGGDNRTNLYLWTMILGILCLVGAILLHKRLPRSASVETASLLGLILALTAPCLAQRPIDNSPPIEFEMLVQEYSAKKSAWAEKYSASSIKSIESYKEARYCDWPGWSYAPKFLACSNTKGIALSAIDPLLQIVLDLATDVSENDRELLPSYTQALALLARDHVNNAKTIDVCDEVSQDQSRSAETYLGVVLDKSQVREVRARACLALARYLVSKGEMVDRPWFRGNNVSPFDRFLMTRFNEDYFKYLSEKTREQTFESARALYERAIKEFGDLPFKEEGWSIGRIASVELNRLQLITSKRAPGIVGEDLKGNQLRLSDYRGKTVVLIFWGSWCPSCKKVLSQERLLAEQFAGQPVVFLGINCGDTRLAAMRSAEEWKLPWRSWWDSESVPGPIATMWGVLKFPAIFIVTPDGRILSAHSSFTDSLAKDIQTAISGVKK